MVSNAINFRAETLNSAFSPGVFIPRFLAHLPRSSRRMCAIEWLKCGRSMSELYTTDRVAMSLRLSDREASKLRYRQRLRTARYYKGWQRKLLPCWLGLDEQDSRSTAGAA